MEIEIERVVVTTKTINTENLRVEMGAPKHIDSNYFNIFHNDECIGDGYLNHKTNWAHVNLFSRFDNETLEDHLIHAIENRDITIN
jgi:hypothetical protein